MPGQPAGKFDVTSLFVQEPGDAADEQQNVVDVGEPIQLRATFEGTGTDWGNMETMGLEYTVTFYAEGMGPGVPNINFGTVAGNLFAGGSPYDINHPVPAGIANEGIYRCGVTVTFNNGGVPWLGWLGFNEDCVVQASTSEE